MSDSVTKYGLLDSPSSIPHIHVRDPLVYGVVIRFDGSIFIARGVRAVLGTICRVLCDDGLYALAEVIGFKEKDTILVWIEGSKRVAVGAMVQIVGMASDVSVGDAILGRVMDADGAPLDEYGEIRADNYVPLIGACSNPLNKGEIDTPFDVGVRVINALIPIGLGQRMSVIAGSGVGKSVLISMICSY